MSIAGVPYQNPLSYTGPQMNLLPIIVFFREPTTSDTKYRIGSVAIIGKDPSSGTQGDLWYLSAFNSSGEAQWLQLLTGAASPGIDSITTDEGAPPVEPDGNGNVNILGGIGCSVTGQGPGDTVTINLSGGGFDWSVIQDATHDIEASNGYFADRGAGVTFTLPATASVGDSFIITGINAGGFTIAQNAGQILHLGSTSTTSGAGGSLSSGAVGDSVIITCSVANTDFWVTAGSIGGSITLV